MSRWINIFHWFHLCGHDSENQQFIRFGQHTVSCFLFGFQQDVYRWVNIVREAGPLASKLSRVLPNNCVLLPFPHRVRHWTFVIDRTHFKNHKTCFSGYNMDEFPQLKSVNSQQGEQINRSLHSLATVLAHLRWETYLKVLELYFVHRILRVKKNIDGWFCSLFCHFGKLKLITLSGVWSANRIRINLFCDSTKISHINNFNDSGKKHHINNEYGLKSQERFPRKNCSSFGFCPNTYQNKCFSQN